jgi:alkane 1-monooxygenase
MRLSDLKYLFAYLVPLACFAGLYYGGWASGGTLYVGFLLVPIIELFVPAAPRKKSEAELEKKAKNVFFDNLLYLNVFALYFNVMYFLWLLSQGTMTGGEILFSILNVGILIGVCGINVAHELGHRNSRFDQWMARILLLPALYSHFTLEHNYGHHLRVGTPEDPATARRDEPVYLFFGRSIAMGYLHAWKIGAKRLNENQLSFWQNEVLLSHIAQLIWLSGIIWFFGWSVLLPYLGAALAGILMLETVNYIEHYGLLRTMLPSGRYAPLSEQHSWNSNHELGRIMLFELVRHADHHQQSTRKYQTLRHLDNSPQLPFGYPMSIGLALIPPLWFRVMNPKLDEIEA